jgi:actin-related protein 8
LHPEDDFNLHFPFRRGDFNQHNGLGGSQTAILSDLETIWTNAVETQLDISRKDFQSFRAVVIIPALYKRPLVKHYMTLLLHQMGFGYAFVLQDHVAATFGAGLGN